MVSSEEFEDQLSSHENVLEVPACELGVSTSNQQCCSEGEERSGRQADVPTADVESKTRHLSASLKKSTQHLTLIPLDVFIRC